jgi:biopolymer transport protein ExbD
MAFSAATRNATLAEMNITPLVDVMLVLLIIFMVATPMLSRQLNLDLPTNVPEPLSPPNTTLDLQIQADGSLLWNGEPVSAAALDAALRVEAAREQLPLLQITVDGAADYQHVAHWLGRARHAGLERIALP